MPGVKRGDMKLRTDIESPGARHRFQELQYGFHVVRHIKGLVQLLTIMLIRLGVPRIFFLQMRRILQQNSGEVDGSGIGEDGAAVTILDEHRQPTGVIQMRVRQHHVVDRLRINREWFEVSFVEFLRALKYAAIDEQAFARRFHEVF